MGNLYTELAGHIAQSIDQGIYLPGDRLPGVRVASRNERVSPATVVAAYRHLETEGYIEARPRSGYFVRSRRQGELSEPETTQPARRPKPVTGQELVLQLLRNINLPNVVQLGANIPDPEFLPTRSVSRALTTIANQYRHRLTDYEVPPGLPALRNHIARRLADVGCIVSPEDVLITAGCQEAVYLSLKSVTQPGDVVAIESPTYYGLLQALDSLGLKALEIPTHPRDGLSIEALKLALEQWPVKACVVVPNFSNPLGALIPDESKTQLVDLLSEYPQVTLIEDDIYGDLNFSGSRPSVIKAQDQNDQVVYCGSYSKSLSAGVRIGWAVNHKLREQLAYEKFVTNCSTSIVSQLMMAKLLDTGGYERHLRGMRVNLAQNMSRMTDLVVEHFPEDSRLTRPRGGMALWVELPRGLDTTALFHEAMEHHISIAPGQIFTTSAEKYQHCLRLNAAVGWSRDVEKSIATLGMLINRALS